MHWLALLSILASALLGVATPVASHWEHLIVKHSWKSVPDKWECQGPPPAGTTIDLHLALKPHNEDALTEALYQVSDPEHQRYGAYLSREQVSELVAPKPDTLQLVNSWLAYHKIPQSLISATHSGWLKLSGVPLAQANSLLGASYKLYHHKETGETILRTMGYALPAALHGPVLTVAPTTHFASARAHWKFSPVSSLNDAELDEFESEPVSGAGILQACTPLATPECLRRLYNTEGYTPQVPSKNRLGIAGYLQQYASHRDLKEFMTRYRSDAVNATFSVVNVNGGMNDEENPGLEASLDIQIAAAISYPTPITFFSTGGAPPFIPDELTPNNTNEPYLELANFLRVLDKQTIPLTISTSYGDDEETVPPDYATSVCNIFAQLGVRGASVIFSSGDSGVGGGSCHTNDGTNRVQFLPGFPASCPFVTTVGATTGVAPAVAVNFSGGGFSNYFAQPSYQKNAVSSYLRQLGTKYSGLFNHTGRAYPDISSHGVNCTAVINQKFHRVDGTSCSAPTVAGVISLLNDVLISEGRPPLGFLNCWLYRSGFKGFNDITSGSNPGCGTDGFSATAGWDPVTGFGTPDFLKLRDILMEKS
ncbi:subtilisin-like protein [Russula brevipes]|nr:subtilisin-like protein [Russula brevipes]